MTHAVLQRSLNEAHDMVVRLFAFDIAMTDRTLCAIVVTPQKRPVPFGDLAHMASCANQHLQKVVDSAALGTFKGSPESEALVMPRGDRWDIVRAAFTHPATNESYRALLGARFTDRVLAIAVVEYLSIRADLLKAVGARIARYHAYVQLAISGHPNATPEAAEVVRVEATECFGSCLAMMQRMRGIVSEARTMVAKKKEVEANLARGKVKE